MMKTNVMVGFLLILFSSSLMAVSYKGQRIYAKNCVICHGKQQFVQSKTAAEWDKTIGKDGKNLLTIHTTSKKITTPISFFKSKKYKRNIRHLRDFLEEYAKDGKVPTCN